MLITAYRINDNVLIEKIGKSLKKDMEQQAAYYESLPDNKREALSSEEERNKSFLNSFEGFEQQFKTMNENKAAPEPAKSDSTPKSDTVYSYPDIKNKLRGKKGNQ